MGDEVGRPAWGRRSALRLKPPDVVHAVGRPGANWPGQWNHLVRDPGKVLALAEVSYAWAEVPADMF